MKKFIKNLLLISITFVIVFSLGCTSTDEETTSSVPASEEKTSSASANTLETIKERGILKCGVNDNLTGFGVLTPDGSYAGFDIDYCKAVAAAIFGDASKVEYTPLTASARFTALGSGEIDLLIRNTTWTASRDRELAQDFTATTFY
ncbi:uncharacterized protein METZ01_LOCUS466532, partial [marine metagenome]